MLSLNQPHKKTNYQVVGQETITKKQTGDSHCRGTRIVINSTFTAGGRSLLIFVVVYGLSKHKMPEDKIVVTLKVPGLTVGSDQDVYSNTAPCSKE